MEGSIFAGQNLQFLPSGQVHVLQLKLETRTIFETATLTLHFRPRRVSHREDKPMPSTALADSLTYYRYNK